MPCNLRWLPCNLRTEVANLTQTLPDHVSRCSLPVGDITSMLFYIVFSRLLSPLPASASTPFHSHLFVTDTCTCNHLYFLLLFSASASPTNDHTKPENTITFPSFYFIFLAAPFPWFDWVTARHLAGKKSRFSNPQRFFFRCF